MKREAPRPCATCPTVTPHVRPPLGPSPRRAALAVLIALAAGLSGGSASAAGALGLVLGVWAVGVARAWRTRVCVRCAKLRVRTERPLRPWDEVMLG